MNAGAGQLPVVDEHFLREICSRKVFERGEAYYRSGAVSGCRIENGMLRAAVQGGHDQPYEVLVSVEDGELVGSCTCPYPEPICKHLVAVLLAWVRGRGSFDHAEMPADLSEDGPRNELAMLLEYRTLPELRQIARRLGITLRGTGKAEILQQLVEGLLQPAGLKAAAARLDPRDVAILDVVCVVGDGQLTKAEVVQKAVALLDIGEVDAGGRLRDMRDEGLVVSGPKPYGENSFYIPQAVLPLLPASLHLARRTSPPTLRPVEPGPRLPPDELLFVLWQYFRQHTVSRKPRPERKLIEQTSESLRGWQNLPEEVDALQNSPEWQWSKTSMTTLPPSSELADADLGELARLTGARSEAVVFAMRLLRDLGLLKGKDRFVAQETAMREFLRKSPASRRQSIVNAWAGLTSWSELMLVISHDKELRLVRKLGGFSALRPEQLFEQLLRGRRLVLAVLSRLAEGEWHSLPSLSQSVFRLAGSFFADRGFYQESEPRWWLEKSAGDRLNPRQFKDWRQGYGKIVEEILRGPLTWLGVATVVKSGDELVFRLDGLRGLIGLEQPAVTAGEPLRVRDDLTILVPSGHGGLEIHDWLLTVAEPFGASADGLHYRLTPAQSCAAFAAGEDAETIITRLSEQSGCEVPATVTRQLRDWWGRYGNLHLYASLNLIELADDYTLPELMATTSLPDKILYQFSPRLIAVDGSAVNDLVAELLRKGYTPKVLEGGK